MYVENFTWTISYFEWLEQWKLLHVSILYYLKYKEGIPINCYLLVYFLPIVSVNWKLWARLWETVISSTILDTIYASTKKKQAHAYSLSCPLTCIIHGYSFPNTLSIFQWSAQLIIELYLVLASHLPESSDILGYAVAIYTVGDFCFFLTN